MRSIKVSSVFCLSGIFSCVVGCASSGAPPAETQPPAPSATPEASAAPASEPETAPTAEELKQKEEQDKLARDFAQLEQDHAAELARLTPEVRAQVKALVDASPADARKALSAALKGPHRRPTHAERDSQRHPLETLQFFGIQTHHKVLEYGPGGGWYTELLAPVLAKRGQLFVTMTNPEGPPSERATLYGKRTQLALDSLPEAYSKVERVVFEPSQPKLGIADGTLDAVLLIRGAHGMYNSGKLDTWLAEFHRTLKPKGTLGIVQQRAAPGADPAVSSKQGYLPEAQVIELVTNAGFSLVAKSEINANPKDTKDHPNGVWTLPPANNHDDADDAKYQAIGESDRMTLRFVKP